MKRNLLLVNFIYRSFIKEESLLKHAPSITELMDLAYYQYQFSSFYKQYA